MVTMRVVKAYTLSRVRVLVGRKGPGVMLRQCVTIQKTADSVICNTQKFASSYLMSS